MPEYLSDAWIEAMNRAVADDPALRAATADITLIVQQTVTPSDGSDVDAGPGTRTWYVRLDHGTNTVVSGAHPAPDVTFRCDRDTALAIAGGHESAQIAFMAGRLRLGGDSRALIAHQGCLTALAAISARTHDATAPAS